MSTIPRLTFPYPHLFKPSGVHITSLTLKPLHASQQPFPKATISTAQPHRQDAFPQRYGTAAEPLPPPIMPPKTQEEKSLASAFEKEVKADPKLEREKSDVASSSRGSDKKAKPEINDKDKPESNLSPEPPRRTAELDASESHPKQPAPSSISDNQARADKPLERVLQTGAPTAEKPEEHKAPHLQAPPYVHHFDTFTLVKDLERGGFSEEQSVTIMKAVRGLLAVNLDVANEGLISKSDVENETYLFRAACSELRTEILNTRKATSTTTRTQLSHLQHQCDILSQRVSQEMSSLKEDLRGMLDDRRMAARMQSRNRDGTISELNYKISVVLGSEQKSEVEGLRWVLTRRAAMGMGLMALLILGSLRYGSYKMHEREIVERKKGAGSQGAGTGTGAGVGFTVPSREMATQTEEKGSIGDESENVGYVSLG